MYVCICNAITDKQIRKAAKNGTTDLWGLQKELGVATGCGSCKEAASEILAEYRRRQHPEGTLLAGKRRRQHSEGTLLAADPQLYNPALA